MPRTPSWLNPSDLQNPQLNIIEFSESSVCSVAKYQSKTLTPKNKNKIFPKFLSPLPTSSYENPASKIKTFFGSKVSTRLIIEAVFFPLTDNMKYEIWDMIYLTLAHFRHFRNFSSLFANLPSISCILSPVSYYNIFPDTFYFNKQTQSQVRQNQRKLLYEK